MRWYFTTKATTSCQTRRECSNDGVGCNVELADRNTGALYSLLWSAERKGRVGKERKAYGILCHGNGDVNVNCHGKLETLKQKRQTPSPILLPQLAYT